MFYFENKLTIFESKSCPRSVPALTSSEALGILNMPGLGQGSMGFVFEKYSINKMLHCI